MMSNQSICSGIPASSECEFSSEDIKTVVKLLNRHGSIEVNEAKILANDKSQGVRNFIDYVSPNADPKLLQWEDFFIGLVKTQSNPSLWKSISETLATLRKELHFSPEGIRPNVQLKFESLPFFNKKGRQIGQIGITRFIPSKEIKGKLPPLLFIPGLNHPAPAYEYFLSEIAFRDGREVIVMDLFSNGGSALFNSRKKITNALIYDEAIQVIAKTIPEGKFDLMAFSLGTAPARKIYEDYHRGKELPDELKGKELNQTVLIAPLPGQSETLAGIDMSKRFLYSSAWNVLWNGAMLLTDKNLKKFDPFTNAHTEPVKGDLQKLVIRNKLRSNLLTPESFILAASVRSFVHYLKNEDITVVFHKEDQLFPLENPEKWQGSPGVLILPGDHSALAGNRVSDQYIDAIRSALHSSQKGESNFKYSKAYRGIKVERFAGVLLGNQNALPGETLRLGLSFGLDIQARLTPLARYFGLLIDTQMETRIYPKVKNFQSEIISLSTGPALELLHFPIQFQSGVRLSIRNIGVPSSKTQFPLQVYLGGMFTLYHIFSLQARLYLGSGDLGLGKRFVWNPELSWEMSLSARF